MPSIASIAPPVTAYYGINCVPFKSYMREILCETKCSFLAHGIVSKWL